MALDKAGRVRPPDELYVNGPGPTEHHDKSPHPPLAAFLVQVRETAPVHLGLFPRICFETDRRRHGTRAATRGHMLLQQGVPALVAQSLQLPLQHHAVLQSLRKPTVNVIRIGVQLGGSPLPGLGQNRLRGVQVLADRIAGKAQPLGNVPGRTARSLHVINLFHVSHL